MEEPVPHHKEEMLKLVESEDGQFKEGRGKKTLVFQSGFPLQCLRRHIGSTQSECLFLQVYLQKEAPLIPTPVSRYHQAPCLTHCPPV